MSRTYRGRVKKNRRGYSGKSRNSTTYTQDLPPVYKNAKRMKCASSMAEKWWFKSKDAALAAAAYNFKLKFAKGKTGITKERAYYCQSCGGWHLTHYKLDEWKERKEEIAHIQGLELDEKGNFKQSEEEYKEAIKKKAERKDFRF